MTLTNNNSKLEPPPLELCRIEGVAGVLFQRGERILIDDLPVPAEQGQRIAKLALEVCEGFRKSRRPLRQLVLGFNGGTLLIHSRDDAQLVLLLMGDADLDLASAAAKAYLDSRFKTRIRLPGTSASTTATAAA
jgi:hypothetical protein